VIRGASWGPDDHIYFSSAIPSVIARVSAAGGTPQPVTTLEGELEHRWPEVLPNGKAVLYAAWSGSIESANIMVRSLETGEQRILIERGNHPHYVPSGHLIFVQGVRILAAPFDADRLEVTGPAVPIVDDVLVTTDGVMTLSASRDGTLSYLEGSSYLGVPRSRLVWVDRNGVAKPLTEIERPYRSVRRSPDGRRIAVTVWNVDQRDVWILDLARDTLSRLTFGSRGVRPVWTPDSKAVTFASSRAGGRFNIFTKPADGSDAVEQLTDVDYAIPCSWSPDGKILVFRERRAGTSFDIGYLKLAERQANYVVDSPYDERHPMLSPDGRWLTYTSDETGRREVYVQPFPGPGGKRQISNQGGTEPMWNPNGKELFYRNGNKMMAVTFRPGQELNPSAPVLLFEEPYEMDPDNYSSNYDVSPDGWHFVMIRIAEDLAPLKIIVVLNWHEELKRLVPTN
jgi:serine/threonine-protein kinase